MKIAEIEGRELVGESWDSLDCVAVDMLVLEVAVRECQHEHVVVEADGEDDSQVRCMVAVSDLKMHVKRVEFRCNEL